MESKQTSTEMVEKGLAALELAEFENAIEIFSRAAIEDSTNSRAWFYLGLCYLEMRETELAIESLNRAIAADPDFADAHYLLGTAMGATGKFDQAARCYRLALEIDSDHHKAEEFLIRTEALLASRQHYRAAMQLIYAESHEPDWMNRAARELLHSVAIFKDSPAKNEFTGLAREIIESGAQRAVFDDGDSEGPFWTRAV